MRKVGILAAVAIILLITATCAVTFFQSDQAIAEEMPLPVVDEAKAVRMEIEAEYESWDFETEAKRIQEEEEQTKGSRSLAETPDIEDRLYEAAIKVQPNLKRRPRHVKRVVWILFEASLEHNVNPFLAIAFASRESGLRSNAYNPTHGEEGLLQLHGYARRVFGKGRDMGQPRANADAGLAYYDSLRYECARPDGTPETDHWILVAAYGSGKCVSAKQARNYLCGKRKRAELIKAVGQEEANRIWPQ